MPGNPEAYTYTVANGRSAYSANTGLQSICVNIMISRGFAKATSGGNEPPKSLIRVFSAHDGISAERMNGRTKERA